ncbi:MAG: hypothetical protein JWM98_1136, partial [Thermoleophilia bacterium]|nr:hypothetical protein [Thermoleophilia bacterium]
ERTAALADVVLPPGRRRGRRAAALWAADAPTPASPAAWRALASAFEHTGLWPVLLDDAAPGDGWVDQLAPSPPAPPVEVGAVAAHLAAAVRAWSEELTPDLPSTDPDYHRELVALLATDAAAGRPASATGRRPDAIAHASAALDAAHLGVVACTRPAQVLERIAWPGARDALDPALLTAVLASWEGRYGALVLGLSADVVTFAVTRPPATIEEAREAAAEQLAACPALTDDWDGFDAHAAALVDAPAWRLRWRDTVGDNRQERAHT